jgi:hypothetical protein
LRQQEVVKQNAATIAHLKDIVEQQWEWMGSLMSELP